MKISGNTVIKLFWTVVFVISWSNVSAHFEAQISWSAYENTVTCQGDSDASATLLISGIKPVYIIKWSTGAIDTAWQLGEYKITGLASGYLGVTVSPYKQAGCATSLYLKIKDPPAIVVATSSVDPNCDGLGVLSGSASGGRISLTPDWGIAPPAYNHTGVAPGSYMLTVTDGLGCTATSEETIGDMPPPIGLEITSTSDPLCSGDCNGRIDITPIGGANPGTYDIIWNDGTTSEDRTGLCSGVYSVTVADSNGCSIANQVSLTEPADLTLSLSGIPPQCYNSCDGQLNAITGGGTGIITYTWDHPNELTANQNPQSSVCGDNDNLYNVTVMDANMCMQTAELDLARPEEVVASA
ncbi:MAG: hypothetical protein IH948_02250, partial [Bacteroidetes bacterium]|nr:hypothetical protein [Bacteroidota bacterium]